jgi:hypothetical protein
MCAENCQRYSSGTGGVMSVAIKTGAGVNPEWLAHELARVSAENAKLRKERNELFAANGELAFLATENATLRAALTEIAGWVMPTGLDAQELAIRALEELKD